MSATLTYQLGKIWKAEQAKDYKTRNKHIFLALGCALACSLEAGVRIDPQEMDWPVAYIELPTGQITWHLQQHAKQWDGHSTDEKWSRVFKWSKEIVDPKTWEEMFNE